jgi:hypothetical protein
MLKIDRHQRKFVEVKRRRLDEAGYRERIDVQAMIRNSPEQFFAEMGEHLLLIAEELRPASFVDDRIDLLALDSSGAVVIIELKRGSNKLQLLQALAYASMVAKWRPEQLISLRAALTNEPNLEVTKELEEFLEGDSDALNEMQRVILIAEAFDFEVLSTAEWLSERYEVDIRCYRLSLSSDAETDFVNCTCIFPPPELSQHAISRKRGARIERDVSWADWDEALSSVSQPVADFFRHELSHGAENYLRKRALRFRHDGRRRWNVHARSDRAYVWQRGRFDDDIEFWAAKLGTDANVEPVKQGSCLRFFLRRPEQFHQFKTAVLADLRNLRFHGSSQLVGDDDDHDLSASPADAS